MFDFAFEETLGFLDDEELDNLANKFMINKKFDQGLLCINEAIVRTQT